MQFISDVPFLVDTPGSVYYLSLKRTHIRSWVTNLIYVTSLLPMKGHYTDFFCPSPLIFPT